jgi:hypothetical protein
MPRLRALAAACAALLFVVQGSTFGQSTLDALRSGAGPAAGANGARIYFDKLLSTYRWQGLLLYDGGGPGVRYSIDQNFLSTLIRTNTNLITDEETFRSFFRFLPGRTVEPLAATSAYILSDMRGLGLSDVSSYSVHAGAAWRPVEVLTVEPLVGFRSDRQSGITDEGPSYLLRMGADSLGGAGGATAFDGSWEYNVLAPRTLETRNARLNTRNEFTGGSWNGLDLRYYRNRRDFYTPADADVAAEFGVERNIETRSEDLYAVRDSILYQVNGGLSFGAGAGVVSRGITRASRYKSYADPSRPVLDTDVDELTIGGELTSAWAVTGALDARMTVALSERNETHLANRDDGYLEPAVDSLRRTEERKNNTGKRTAIALAAEYRFSAAHRVEASASGSILRYDTPSPDNSDDRDDLWYLVNVTSSHRINRHLSLTVAADVNLQHLVYLGSSRSADNAWNRIFRLSPRLVYEPGPAFTTANRFEVLANYTAYDFDAPGAAVRSFSFRQFAFVDSTVWTITRRTSIEWVSFVRLYERGTLRWSDFSERPVSSFEDFTHIGMVRYSPSPALIFSIGIRYFSQMRYDYAGNDRVPQYFLRSVGPASGIEWTVSGRTAFLVRGWYERQSRTNLPDQGIANITMSLNVSI